MNPKKFVSLHRTEIEYVCILFLIAWGFTGWLLAGIFYKP